MTEEDIKPKRKKYHDEKYYRRRKVKNAETQTKKPETEHKDGEKENLTKALVKSTLHAQANPLLCLPAPAEPIAGPILEGLPMEGVPDRMNLIEAPKIEAPKTPSSLASEVISGQPWVDCSIRSLRSHCLHFHLDIMHSGELWLHLQPD